METFGLVIALTVGFFLTLGGIGLAFKDGDRSFNIMKGLVYVVVGVGLFYWGQGWFFDHYDILRTK